MQGRLFVGCASLVSILAFYAPALAGQAQPAPAAKGKHVVVAPADLKWGPAPPSLPPGAEVAVLDGDPGKAGPFSMRLKLPDGYRVPPHWHPTDENLVILQGALMVGMGDKVNAASEHALSAGTYTKMPAEMRHYAYAKGETTFQLYGVGPFEVNYVNPGDDPRKTKKD
jgi:quercetin dioxygenase-like cupin family protein